MSISKINIHGIFDVELGVSNTFSGVNYFQERTCLKFKVKERYMFPVIL
jgi:hypothetical protein